jgi:crossover junction endodeoxyribonuclease RuvC
MIYVGIDPGKNGGICFLSREGDIYHISPMPEEKTFAELIKSSAMIISSLCIEESRPYPGQGVVSMFNYGSHFGLLKGVVIANNIPITLVPPRTWQKHMILPSKHKDPKAKALESANKVFRKTSHYWLPSKRHKKPHDGMIDSALIAEYCRRLHYK